MRVKYLMIGGGLSCSQAAKIIRTKDDEGSILLVGEQARLPYDLPPLSKDLLRGEKTPEEITYDPQSFFDEKKINVRLGRAVVGLNAKTKRADLDSGERIEFEKALIATGGTPEKLDAPGASLAGVHYLRTMDDALAIAAAAEPAGRAVVIGAGFIGMEVAASLTQLGLAVTVIETLPRIWPRFLDDAFAGHIQQYCADRGIEFLTGERVTELRGADRVTSVAVESGRETPCDFVCVGVGIRPNIELAQKAGLDVDDGVLVDGYLRTSAPDIYAGGDIVNFPDPIFGKRRRVEHWGHAEYCGQVAGLNMTGARQSYDLLTYVWSDIFDLHIEFAGDESERDRIITRGRIGDDTFTILYLKHDKLRAYFAVNANSREFPKMQRLIRKGVDIGGKDAELRDPSFELKDLLT